MTTQGKSLEELGRRAVACKHWRWLEGMRIVHMGTQAGRGKPVAARLCSLGDDDAFVMESRNAGTFPSPFTGNDQWAPDLDDPATLGCLLHLVREAWPDEWCEFMVPIFDGFSHWRVGCLQLERLPGTPQVISLVNQETMKPLAWAYSEAEALVIALEAAP